MQRISMIAAMAKGRVIGDNNRMPWHLPADLKHFKAVTVNKPVIMGRKTYESIGKALPKRRNIVISRTGFTTTDAEVVTSLAQALQLVSQVPEVMIIGGGNVYAQCLPLAHRLYLTFIEMDVKGDTLFPDYEAEASWQCVEEQAYNEDDSNPYPYRFVTLERV